MEAKSRWWYGGALCGRLRCRAPWTRRAGAAGAAAALLALYLLCAAAAPGRPRGRRQVTTVATLTLSARSDVSGDVSRCGPTATARGPHQRVVSFCFYGGVNHPRGYFKGIARSAAAVGRLYPGWTMRVYHEVPPGGDSPVSRELDTLSTQFPHLDLCYVGDVPGYGDLRGRVRKAWRFLPMADPLVDVFVSRDLDALPLQREADAVAEWLQSNATFHVMRDHPFHNAPIMGGMWGARPERKREALREFAEVVCARAEGRQGRDQVLLGKHVWPAIRDDVWQHDAYRCDKYRSHGNMQAFPTRRNMTATHNFVGNMDGGRLYLHEICPLNCRPAQHQDWYFC